MFKVLQSLKPFVSDRYSANEPGAHREEASFGKAHARSRRHRERSATALEGGPEYMIDFVDQNHAFKPTKLIHGLTQFYNDVLRDHSRKHMRLVRLDSTGPALPDQRAKK